MYETYRSYINDILNHTLSHIDADDLEHCIETGEESESYKQTLLFMDDMMEHFEDIHYFYAVTPLNTNETGSVMSVLSAERYYDRYIDTEGNLYLGWISDDEYDPETAAQLFEIMEGDELVFFEEETEWGTDYTGAIPIKNSEGKGITVLAIDIDVSFLEGMLLKHNVINSVIIVSVGLFFILIFLLWSRRNITAPIRSLEKSAVGFVNQSHGQRDLSALEFSTPEIPSDNEIKSLSDAITKMTSDMRDYVSDIIEAEKKAASMQELANRDSLTGIRNKTAYDVEVERIEERLASGDTEFGLAMIDLNFLKKVNDIHGHDKGNDAIRKLCRLVCTTFEHSPVFRIGGDEFVVVLRGNDMKNYETLLKKFQRMQEEFAADDTLEPWEKVSASIGAAFYDGTVDDGVESVFKRADQKMYEYKKAMKAERT